MARPLRVEWLGAWYHVTARGNERRRIFRDEKDRRHFMELLAQIEERYGVEVHCYVLMENHYHLMVRLSRPSGLSSAMHWLGVSYTIWFNRRHRRAGHLFQGRFKAVIVDFEQWGCTLSRYIHLNPARVVKLGLGKADRAADRLGRRQAPEAKQLAARKAALFGHRWSSLGAYCAAGKSPPWLHTKEILGCFGSAARSAYRRYVNEAVGIEESASPWSQTTAGFILGSARLLKRVAGALEADPREQSRTAALRSAPTIETIASLVARFRGEAVETFVSRYGDWGRDMIFLLARRHAGLTNRALAAWAGNLDDSAVAQAVRRLQQRLAVNRRLRKTYEQLIAEMSNVKI